MVFLGFFRHMSIKDILRRFFYPKKINVLEGRLTSLFLTHYKDLAAPRNQKTTFKNVEFKVYSKHGTDGILAHIFSKISPTNRIFVEIGVETGRECNTANLSLNLGWSGILIDANEEWIKLARNFYKEKLGSRPENVKAIASFITAENINQILGDNGVMGEIDLLSIDIDGNDYWVWQAINTINSRVVVLEYNPALGQRSLAIKYDPKHHYNPRSTHPLYFGTSLVALTKLAKKKGYVLVACDSHGQDAFFVRDDVAEGKFIELTPEKAFYPNPQHLTKIGDAHEQFEQIKNLEFQEI